MVHGQCTADERNTGPFIQITPEHRRTFFSQTPVCRSSAGWTCNVQVERRVDLQSDAADKSEKKDGERMKTATKTMTLTTTTAVATTTDAGDEGYNSEESDDNDDDNDNDEGGDRCDDGGGGSGGGGTVDGDEQVVRTTGATTTTCSCTSAGDAEIGDEGKIKKRTVPKTEDITRNATTITTDAE